MNADWQSFLEQHGARVESGEISDFGDGDAELRAAASAGVVADLSHPGVLHFTGADAEAFLQGQLSCDVKGIDASRATLGAYCTPKGRMLADFFLLRYEGGFAMLLARALVAPIQKRLRMFVLRSKVEVADRSDALVALGIAGAATMPENAFHLPGDRFLLLLSVERAMASWPTLASTLKPVGSPAWRWLDIRAGIPLIEPATQDQLVPQMANLELIGGVSFSKGCYPGQEIVARSQYLGKVKRRMFRARIAAGTPKAGDALYSDDLGAQASGLVVNVARAPDGEYELLAVTHVESHDKSTVRLGAPDGPALRFEPLPYEVK